LSKKEKQKLMDNYGTEKTEDNNISIDLENKIIKKTTKKSPKNMRKKKIHYIPQLLIINSQVKIKPV
jgi:hypothetical protein